MAVQIHYGPVKNNETGKYEFAQVYGMGSKDMEVHAIGYCRENKLDDHVPCEHETEKDAIECYQRYELRKFVAGEIDVKDIVMPKEIIVHLQTLLELVKTMHGPYIK